MTSPKDFLIEKIGDPKLYKILGCVSFGDKSKFNEVIKEYPKYDTGFLWMLCYQSEGADYLKKYIEDTYQKYKQILDNGFLKKLSSADNFGAHMWELVLCDCLNSSGKLEPKGKAGADFILINPRGEKIQIEAVVPNETVKENLRSVKPDYTKNKIATLSGSVENLELPILLRFLDSFKKKSKKYSRDMPLIIAINSYKIIGFSSRDNYVLRRVLFGLGCDTISKRADGSFMQGFEQTPFLSLPEGSSLPSKLFWDPAYSHVSGIIYASQNPAGLLPEGYGWSNYGITFIPNPLADIKVNIDLPYFRKLECTEHYYEESEAKLKFEDAKIKP